MTTKQRYKAQCIKCGVDAVCPNCNQTVDRATPFSLWLRELEYPLDSQNYSCHNLDYIWYFYRSNWLITIEEKTNSWVDKQSLSQKQTHSVIAQMLSYASGIEVWNTMRNKKEEIYYKGHFVVRFMNNSPADSDFVWINNVCYGWGKAEQAVKHLLQNGEMLKLE